MGMEAGIEAARGRLIGKEECERLLEKRACCLKIEREMKRKALICASEDRGKEDGKGGKNSHY